MTAGIFIQGKPWEPPCVGEITCPSWECRTCGHNIYDHSVRKEPNNGLQFYANCKLPNCKCAIGENHRYPKGLIDS